MSLILCGGPKQDQQEDLLLRFIMIYFGVQLINMTITKLQNKQRERPSYQDEPSPYSVFQSSFNSSTPKKPTKFFIPYQF